MQFEDRGLQFEDRGVGRAEVDKLAAPEFEVAYPKKQEFAVAWPKFAVARPKNKSLAPPEGASSSAPKSEV